MNSRLKVQPQVHFTKDQSREILTRMLPLLDRALEEELWLVHIGSEEVVTPFELFVLIAQGSLNTEPAHWNTCSFESLIGDFDKTLLQIRKETNDGFRDNIVMLTLSFMIDFK